MEVKNKNNLVLGQSEVLPKLSKNETLHHAQEQSKELVSSEASLASRAYAAPQVNFGNQWDKAIKEILSKPANKIHLSPKEYENLLEHIPGVNVVKKANGGSHHKAKVKGERRPFVTSEHDKEVGSGAIKTLQNYLREHKIQTAYI